MPIKIGESISLDEISKPYSPTPAIGQAITLDALNESAPKPMSFMDGLEAGFKGEKVETGKGIHAADVGQVIGRSGPAAVLGGIGAIAGPLGAGVGAAAGESIRRAGAALMTKNTDTNIVGNIGGPALEGASQYLGARYLPGVLTAIGKTAPVQAVKSGIKAMISGTGENILKPGVSFLSSIDQPALQRIYDRPSEVFSKVGANTKDVADAAKAFVEVVDKNTAQFHQTYKNIIDGVLKGDTYGPDFKISLSRPLGEVIDTTRKEFGYGVKGRVFDKAEQKVFDTFANRAKDLGDASVEDVYYFQKDLNNISRKYAGEPIGAALGKIKTKVGEVLTKEIPEIKEANAIYAEGMEMVDDLSKLAKSDTPASAIRSAQRRQSMTWEKMLDLADKSAEARQVLDNFYDIEAAQQMTKIFPKMGKTGFAPGAIIAGGIMAQSPMTLATGAAAAPFLSPRISGLATGALSKAGDVAKDVIGSESLKTGLGLSAGVSSASLARGIVQEIQDHPQFNKEQAKEVALQELAKDPKTYD